MKSLTLNFLYLISFAFVSAFDTHAFTSLNNNKVMGFEDRTFSNNLPIEKQAVDIDSQDFAAGLSILTGGTITGGLVQYEQVVIMLKPLMGGAKDDNQFHFRNLCQNAAGNETPANIEIAGVSTDAGGNYCSNTNPSFPDFGYFQYDSDSSFTGTGVIFNDLSHAFVNCSQTDFVNVLSNPQCHGRLIQIQINCGGTCNGNPNTNKYECENPSISSGYGVGTWTANYIAGDVTGGLPLERMFFLKKDASFTGLVIDSSTTINNKSNLTIYPRDAAFALEGGNWYEAYDLEFTAGGNPMVNGSGLPCNWDTGINIDSTCIQELNNIYDVGGYAFKVPGSYKEITFANAYPPNLTLNAWTSNYTGPNVPYPGQFGVWTEEITPYMGAPDGLSMWSSCEGINGGNVPSDF